MTMNGPQSGASDTAGDVFASRGVAEAWRTGAADRDRALGPATELMLDLAGVQVGSWVLDVGAGTGEQTLSAARRVGPTGCVVATDISESMLALAAEAVHEAGLTNVQTRVMDAQRVELEPDSFGGVISRLTVMLLPNPRAALVGMRGVLKPGGKLAALVYAAAERNPFLSLPLGIVRRTGRLETPKPGGPGMFALGDPAVFADLLRTAGFRDVTIRAVAAPRSYPSMNGALRYLRESTPLLREPLAQLSEAQRASAWTEIERELSRFESDDGFKAPGEVLIGGGVK